MKKIWDNKVSIIAATGILLGLFMSKGAVAVAVMPLVRVLIPIVIALFIFSLVKNRISETLGGGIKKKMQAAMEDMQKKQQQTSGGKQQAQTIDLCNKCGAYKAPGHVCK